MTPNLMEPLGKGKINIGIQGHTVVRSDGQVELGGVPFHWQTHLNVSTVRVGHVPIASAEFGVGMALAEASSFSGAPLRLLPFTASPARLFVQLDRPTEWHVAVTRKSRRLDESQLSLWRTGAQSVTRFALKNSTLRIEWDDRASVADLTLALLLSGQILPRRMRPPSKGVAAAVDAAVNGAAWVLDKAFTRTGAPELPHAIPTVPYERVLDLLG